jgi:PrcB C-terminal
MILMRRLLLALTLLASTTAAQTTAPTSYQVSDITLYGLQERHAIFYGTPGTVRQGSRGLNLTRGSSSASGLNVPNSLRVNGQASLRLPIDKLGAAIVVRTRAGLRLISRVPLTAVYYFDGSRWFTLSGRTAGSQNMSVTPTPRASIFGAGALNQSEAEAVGRYLTRRGGEVVVGVVPALPAAATLTPAPSAYRKTALVVQVGVRTLLDTSLNPIQPLPPVVNTPDTGSSNGNPGSSGATLMNMIGSGSQSLYAEQDLGVRLDATPEAFAATWQIVTGNQVPAPSAPFVDFTRSKVVTVFMGQKPTGGYGLKLLSSNLENGTLRLQLETSEPAPGVFTTQAITSPYLMFEVGADVSTVAVELVPAVR